MHDIDAALSLELTDEEVLKLEIEVFTSESGVSVGGLHLEDTSRDLEDGDIESSTTEIIDSDDLAISLVHAEGKSGSRRLIDDTLDLKVSDLASVLGGLPLRVIEVSGDGDDSLLDGGAEIRLSGLLHLGEDEGADLGW